MGSRRSRENELVVLLTGVPWWSVPIAFVATASLLHVARASVPIWGPMFWSIWYFWAGFVALLFAAGWWRGRRRRLLLEASRDLAGLRAMPWREFELLVGQYFRSQGYAVTERGGGGADGGVDLEVRRAGETLLVQCKRWKQQVVKIQPVRELWGVVSHERATGAVFVTSGRFTADARAFAAGKRYRLIDGEELLSVVAEARQTAPPASQPEPATAGAEATCPRCGSAMVRRPGVGGRPDFWGCSRFPSCRGLVPIG